MQNAELNVISRTPGVKSGNNKLRAEGFVPASIYGPGSKSESCAVNEKEMRKVFKNEFESNYILNLKSTDSKLSGKKVVLKSLERDPLHWNVIHADFYEVKMDRPLTAKIPLHWVGTCEDVKQGNGIFQVIRRHVTLRALPGDLPEFLEVDVSGLSLGKGLHVSDLKISDKLKVVDPGNFALVSIAEPEKEEVVTPVAAAAGEGEGAAAAAGTAAAAGDAKAGDAKAAAGDKAAGDAKAAPKK